MPPTKNKSGIRGIQKVGNGWRIGYIYQRPTGEVSIRYKAFKYLEDAIRFKMGNEDIILCPGTKLD